MNEKTVGEVFGELRELLVAYARQETVVPLTRLKHYLGFGVAGAFALSLGLFLISLGILRGLQHLSWTSAGWGSLVPYVGMGAFMILVLVASGLKIRKSLAGAGMLSGSEPEPLVDVLSDVAGVS